MIIVCLVKGATTLKTNEAVWRFNLSKVTIPFGKSKKTRDKVEGGEWNRYLSLAWK